jgi:hypothetical protein
MKNILYICIFVIWGGVTSAQTTSVAPPGVRTFDQVFVTLFSNSSGTYASSDFKLSFSPRGFIFATTTFVFPAVPAGFFSPTTESILVDLGTGVWLTYPSAGGTLIGVYPTPGYYTLRYRLASQAVGDARSVAIQAKFNPLVTYSSFSPDALLPILGDSYTPSSGCAAYPTGAMAPSFTTPSSGFGRAYVKYRLYRIGKKLLPTFVLNIKPCLIFF